MCRWLASRREPVFVDTLITEPQYFLVAQSLKAHATKTETNGDGFWGG